MRGGSTVLHALLFGLMSVGLACGPEVRLPGEAPDPLFDPQLVVADADRMVLSFDGAHSSLKRGLGWYDNERHRDGQTAWSARSSTVFFERPVAAELELVAACTPVHCPELGELRLVPRLNGISLPAIALSPGKQIIRCSLPTKHLHGGVNSLELEFSYSSHSAGCDGQEDRRNLAARFWYLAVAEKGLSEEELLQTRGHEISRGRLRISSESAGVLLPVARRSALRIQIEPVNGDFEHSELLAELIDSEQARQTVYRGRVDREQLIELDRATARPTRLLLSVQTEDPTPKVLELQLKLLQPDPRSSTETVRQTSSRPNVFVYMVDTLRADALQACGSAQATSPRISEFAADAVVFENAWSTSAWTFPSTASVLTGAYPFRHGLTQLEHMPPDDPPTLAESMRRLGYDTLGVSQNYIVNSTYGLDRGFDHFFLNDVLGKNLQHSENLRWFLWRHLLSRDDPSQPLFAYFHSVDPHALYVPRGLDRRFAEAHPGHLQERQYNPEVFVRRKLGEDESETRHLHGLYLGEVRYADRQFGAFVNLLKANDLYEQSLIVLLSDHGEEFYEHGGFSHTWTLFEELLHVPMIVKFPGGWKAGARVRQRVSGVDLAATVLDVVGSDPTSLSEDGMSMRALLTRPAGAPARPVYAETTVKGQDKRYSAVDLTAIVVDNIKCIYSRNRSNQFFEQVPAYRVFDLSRDPEELSPIALDDPAARRCTEELAKWVALADELRYGGDGTEKLLSTEARERLRALGYVE